MIELPVMQNASIFLCWLRYLLINGTNLAKLKNFICSYLVEAPH